MNIPRFWASSDPQKAFTCWHWSNQSHEDARQRAEEKSRNVSSRWNRQEPLDRYAYGNGAIREEIIQTICANPASDAAEPDAIITRNLYGSLVLNTKAAMFIDIDFPPLPKRGALSSLFGKRAEKDDRESAALARLDAFAAQRPDLGLRVYRTCAGLRCLATTRTYDPADPQSLALLESAGSDPLYIRLCRAQACFRARLTPKPWRSGTTVPPSRYPFTSEEQVAKYRKWQTDYDRAIAGFSVCRFLRHLGPSKVAPQLQPLIELHDHLTATTSNRALA
jgi:hypothetical protein